MRAQFGYIYSDGYQSPLDRSPACRLYFTNKKGYKNSNTNKSNKASITAHVCINNTHYELIMSKASVGCVSNDGVDSCVSSSRKMHFVQLLHVQLRSQCQLEVIKTTFWQNCSNIMDE